jgi:hypothetical protein
VGRKSLVGIRIRYGLDGPGIESRWGEVFPIRSDRLWSPPSLLYSGYCVSFLGVKRPGRDVDHSPNLATGLNEVKIQKSYTSNAHLGLHGLSKAELLPLQGKVKVALCTP